MIDLGLVNLAEYYTGIILGGIAMESGSRFSLEGGMITCWGSLERIMAPLGLGV